MSTNGASSGPSGSGSNTAPTALETRKRNFDKLIEAVKNPNLDDSNRGKKRQRTRVFLMPAYSTSFLPFIYCRNAMTPYLRQGIWIHRGIDPFLSLSVIMSIGTDAEVNAQATAAATAAGNTLTSSTA